MKHKFILKNKLILFLMSGVLLFNSLMPVSAFAAENVVPESTAEPTIEPTVEPSIQPTPETSSEPTAEPTLDPGAESTLDPETSAEEETEEEEAQDAELLTPEQEPEEKIVEFDLEAAKQALQDILNQKFVLALVYLCESYQVKSEPLQSADTVATVYSGQTVEILDVELNNDEFWFKTSFYPDGENISIGYIQRDKLAYSDELLLAWEEEYIIPWLNANAAGKKMVRNAAVKQTSADIEQFPESYKEGLYALKAKYPNWTFVKVKAKHDWDTAVYYEAVDDPLRSLVYSTAPSAWKGQLYDSPWYYATRLAVEYCMDPRNYFTDKAVFQFEQLTYNASYHSETALNSILASTFMSGKIPNDSNSRTYAKAFMELGSKYTVSPYHFAARVYQEQGKGTSPLISGTYPGYEGYYNYFNVKASGVGEAVYINGLQYAKEQGWSTRFKSLDGGASTIGNNYIKKGQDTLYSQKFNVVLGVYSHQYMQNIQAPTSEATKAWQFYNASGALNNPFVFKIPVFDNMPADICPADPVVKATGIELEKDAYEMELGDTLTLYANVKPGNTTDKSVTWKSSKTAVATIDEYGKITPVSAGTTTITVTTADGTNFQDSCMVTVKDGIKSFTINKQSTLLEVGARETLTAAAESHAGKVLPITWKSSNEEVAVVSENGEITAKSAGNALIKASASADGGLDVQVLNCAVNVIPSQAQDEEEEVPDNSAYPISQYDKLAAEPSVLYLQSYGIQYYDNDAQSQVQLQIQNQYGEIQDAELFQYQSANESIVMVDQQGKAVPNPDYSSAKIMAVKVTANLKDDPLSRKVTFTVNVLPNAQVNQVIIQELRDGTPEDLTTGTQLYHAYNSEDLKSYTFQAVYKGTNGENMNAKVKWSLTDTKVAALKVNNDNTVTVTMKKEGSTALTCQVQDQWKLESSIILEAITTTPIQVDKTITLNVYRDVNNDDKVLSESFNLVEMNGCNIMAGTSVPVLLKKGNEEVPAAGITMIDNKDGSYRLAFSREAVQLIGKGKYALTYNVQTAGPAKLGKGNDVIDNYIAFTLQVVEKKPAVSIGKASINLQNTDQLQVPLTVKSNEVITNIKAVSDQSNSFDQYVSFFNNEGIWYVELTEAGKTLAPKTITGKVNVSAESYKDITINLSVVLQNKKITLTQSTVPSVQVKDTFAVSTDILNMSTKEILEYYRIVTQESAKLQVSRNTGGSLTMTLKEGAAIKNGETLSAKVNIMATGGEQAQDIWKDAVAVTVKVKVYNTSAPQITMGKTSLSLNLNGKEEGVKTAFDANRQGQSILPAGEWKLYRYDTKSKNYVRSTGETEPVKIIYSRINKEITLRLNTDNEELLKAGTYKYRLNSVLDGYESVNRDFTVVIKDTPVSAAISVSGKLDLLKRSESTLTGKVTLKNIDGKIAGITLYEPDTDQPYSKVNGRFYAILNDNNTFLIKARTGAILFTKSTEVPVIITLQDGKTINTKMNIKPTQSVPKVKNPETRSFYLNSTQTQTQYDLAGYIPDNVTLSKVKVSNVPKGFTADINGTGVIIKTDTNGIKKGNYKITVNLYFKGTQPLYGYPDGKPVSKTINIKVN